MSTKQTWYVPSKSKGNVLIKTGPVMDKNFYKAVSEIAKSESATHGYLISPATLLHNLAMKRGDYYTKVRRRIRTRYEELNREQLREQVSIHNQKQQETT